MAQLITATDVLLHSPAGVGFPNKPICDHLDLVEETVVNECLGTDLYEHLVGLLNPIPDGTADWVECGDYSTGNVVYRNGLYYISLSDTNNTDPADDPANWELYPKFSTDCTNTLWERYLRRILAYKVFYHALPFATMQTGAAGLTVQLADSRGERAANGAEIAKLQENVARVISVTLDNLKTWINDTAQSACGFPSSPLSGCVGCTDKMPRANPRFMW